MPAEITIIKSVGVSFESTVVDKIGAPAFGSTKLQSIGVTFEMNAADRKFLETTTVRSVGVTFEYSQLYVEMINTHRG